MSQRRWRIDEEIEVITVLDLKNGDEVIRGKRDKRCFGMTLYGVGLVRISGLQILIFYGGMKSSQMVLL